jgi:hypothetical protein
MICNFPQKRRFYRYLGRGGCQEPPPTVERRRRAACIAGEPCGLEARPEILWVPSVLPHAPSTIEQPRRLIAAGPHGGGMRRGRGAAAHATASGRPVSRTKAVNISLEAIHAHTSKLIKYTPRRVTDLTLTGAVSPLSSPSSPSSPGSVSLACCTLNLGSRRQWAFQSRLLTTLQLPFTAGTGCQGKPSSRATRSPGLLRLLAGHCHSFCCKHHYPHCHCTTGWPFGDDGAERDRVSASDPA